MLTIAEALDRLLSIVTPLEPVLTPLSECVGQTLAADVSADLDSPPFDKAMMDGYAVRAADLELDEVALQVVDLVTAGQTPTRAVEARQAIQIMTGAPIPGGADVVVKIEETVRDGDRVRISTNSKAPGTHIVRQGNSVRKGDVVLRAGLTLNAARIGALAELGRDQVLVYPRPRVAVLATGDELVPVNQTPGPGQIRNSNQEMLVAQIRSSGAVAIPLGIARDERDDLRVKIQEGLQADVLVLSGGVSAGLLDLVPSELAAAGVTEVFHKVEMKPGKPVWFGSRPAEVSATGFGGPPTLVFGLPGNPVSSLVCCELFVKTAIRRLMGKSQVLPQAVSARLEHNYAARADRPTYHPARLTWTTEGPLVTLVSWHGSSDLCSTVQANGMAFLSGEARQFRAGDKLETYVW